MRFRWGRRRPEQVPEQARAAFNAGLTDGMSDLTPVAETYLAWAGRHGTPAHLAEAYRMRAVVTSREALRRGLPAEQYRVLARTGGAAAEAGLRLAEAGRVRDAVAVVEHARAVLLTRLTGGLDPRVRAALAAAGRPDLVAAYEAAIRQRADAYRGLYRDRQSSSPALVRQGRAFATAAPSDLEQASAKINRVARAVTAVIGPADPLEIPAFESILQAADPAPVVYLAMTDGPGFALVVRNQGEPRFVPLPDLRASDDLAALEEQPPVPNAVATAIRRLAAALKPLVREVHLDPEIALVALGPLGNLPVNAALLETTVDDPTREPLAVRSMPNARSVRGPAPSVGATTRVLVVDVGDAPGLPELRDARRQAAALIERYGTAAYRLSDATCGQVLDLLPAADLVQFLCHGQAELDDPLRGGLELSDGRLSVGTLMGRPPGRPQLVILAACESQSTGHIARNEAVGLPAALMQAGVAGVIAAQWRVDERAAMLLLNRFHDLLATGRAPARALTDAQCWLRTATGADIAARYPDLAGRRASPAFAARRDAEIRYAQPFYWAAFGYTGC